MPIFKSTALHSQLYCFPLGRLKSLFKFPLSKVVTDRHSRTIGYGERTFGLVEMLMLKNSLLRHPLFSRAILRYSLKNRLKFFRITVKKTDILI